MATVIVPATAVSLVGSDSTDGRHSRSISVDRLRGCLAWIGEFAAAD